MNNLDTSALDFANYKASLKNFMKTQTQFKDYDFEGSNLSVLIDLLAYNTFHNAFYNNMALSEMFLDSAQLRSAITSHAKSLNYLPRSKRSATGSVKVILEVTDGSPFVTIPARTFLNSPNSNGRSFKFYTQDSVTITPVNGIYESDEIPVFEGSLKTEKYFISDDMNKKYSIGSADIDTTTLKVYITNSDGDEEEYRLAESIYGINDSSKVYYLQLSNDTYEVYFGMNAFGRQPDTESVLRVEYLISSGGDANGTCEFFASSRIDGYKVARVLPVTPAHGGTSAESNESIRKNAPKSYQIQDRAVSESDYENILKNQFPEVQAISVIGGEELSPPVYGSVFVYVDSKGIDGISENLKDKIVSYIKPRMPIGISVKVDTPNFFFVEVNTTVTFDKNVTNKSKSDIRKISFDTIKEHIENNFTEFGSSFYHSKLETAINLADTATLSNVTYVRVYSERELLIGVRNDFAIDFGMELIPITDYAYRAFASENPNVASLPELNSKGDTRPPTVASSTFNYNGTIAYIRDNGAGVLQVVRNSGNREVVLNKNIGAVNYKTGAIRINKLIVQGYTGSGVKFYAVPKNRDFKVPKNTLVSIRNEDLKVNANTN